MRAVLPRLSCVVLQIDNCATGSTLKANGLVIIDTLMSSSTRLFAYPNAFDTKEKKQGCLCARARVVRVCSHVSLLTLFLSGGRARADPSVSARSA